MIKTSLIAASVLAASAAVANAQPAEPAAAPTSSGSIGLGAEYQVGFGSATLGGISANYDTSMFHAGAFFGMQDPSGAPSTIEFGGRFWYHVAHAAAADFSVGGSVGVGIVPGAMGGHDTDILIEPGFQIRAWVTPNVALSFTGAFSILTGDPDTSLAIGGQVTGTAGVHYYFR
ncbi:MAG TPA: hypothetical protein VGM88_15865 [Kofleriaceae bacterium]